MRLERELFGDWCSSIFRPSYGNQRSRIAFEETLDKVNEELGKTKGPFFLEELSIVDLQFVTHVERMLASVPYWAGFKIRGATAPDDGQILILGLTLLRRCLAIWPLKAITIRTSKISHHNMGRGTTILAQTPRCTRVL